MGYYAVTGKPQAGMVHVNVGTANALCGLINAFRGNLPVLFSAGRTPYTEAGERIGRRSGEIHWPQEMRDQSAMVREVAAQQAKGATVSVLGLEACWSATHGTAHTLRHARECGLSIVRVSWEGKR